ncbi:MAG: nitroreductase family protein [Spirochaetota bacterium]|nr:nitroreductase family protein [Spirochaetota bacterium]
MAKAEGTSNRFLENYRGAYMPPTQFPEVEFDADKCSHCKRCVDTCPTQGLHWDEEKKIPYMTGYRGLETACIGCNNCEAVCKSGCIRVKGEYRVLFGRYKTPEDKLGDMIPPCPFGDRDLNRDFKEIEKDLTETESVILKRRSIRLFQDKPVPKELIHRIIEAARFAPTAGNCQPFKLIVVTDKKMIEEVDKQCIKITNPLQRLFNGKSLWRRMVVSLLSYIMVNGMDQRPIPAVEKMNQIETLTFGAPVVIHVLKDKRGISNPDLDVGIASQNLVIAAHSLGLGTCYIGFEAPIRFLPSLKKKLGIIHPYEWVTTICVGYPKGEIDHPVARGRIPVDWIEG